MSSTIPRSSTSNCSSGSESDSDQDWDDWVQEDEGVDYQGSNGGLKLNNSDSKSKSSTAGGPRLPTLALFPDSNGDKQTFSSPAEAIQHARDNFGVDLLEVVNRCALDPLQVIRLLNHLRRSNTTLTPQSLKDLKGNENFLNDDQELKPVEGAEMDGLLQIDFDEMISNQLSTQETSTNTVISTSDFIKNKKKISELESELKSTQSAFNELRRKYAESLGIGKSDSLDDSNTSTSKPTPATSSNTSKPSSQQTSPVEVKRDDDTHYFDSYSSNEIHQVMISDSIRTLSYAKFILSPSNSHLFKDKVIMDVGCGSGILSMFAARAGAKKVLAIDASKVAEKAKENFKENELDHKIQIFNGKIEELKKELEIWEGKVDLIVSEWMGYFLLYESMLPSVLHARDLYLNKRTGILAPSHCRMTLALIQDQELIEDKIHFWKDVYGFKMNYMIKGCFDDAYTEIVKEDKLVSNVENIFDLPLQILDVKQPEFKSKFNLKVSKSSSSNTRSDGLIEIHAFISWFDTWFYPNPPAENGDENDRKHPIPNNGRKVLKGGEILNGLTDCITTVIAEKDVNGLDLKGNQILESSGKDGEGEIVSFTTGPHGKPTHWKQTLFMLKEPILAKEGTLVSGEIRVNQSDSNSRELDVEIHYSVKDEEEEEKGKKVTAQLVQLFKVR